MIITHKLKPMDLTHKQNASRVDVVQDDKYSRDVEFTLTENGVAWQIPDGTTAVVRYKKPDGTGGNYDTLPDGSTAYQINGNVLTVALAPQVCTVPGQVQLSVGLIHGNAEINTFSVNIIVQPNPGSTYQSEDYIKLSGAVPNSGWTPNMYLGTDESGNVVAKELSGGGGGTVSVDSTLTQSGQAADAAVVGEKFSELSGEIANLQTSGLTTAQVNALDGMFKVAAYDDSKDVSGAYAAFKAAFGLVDSGDTGGGGEETPDVTTYTITAELVNVTSSNSATSITEGASYTATLTAADGYKLDTVSVLMGGVDVTADVYADGVISIPAVTGDVEIVASASAIEDVKAVLPEDGLLAYFDFRNVAESSGNSSKGYYIPATKGTGRMYGWYKAGGGNDYGSPASTNPDFCAGDSYTIHDFGSEFTWILKSYCSVGYTVTGFKNYITPSNVGAVLGPTYNTAEGTAAVSGGTIGRVTGYNDVVIRASNGLLTVFVKGEITNEFNGNDISDFVSWYSKATIGVSWNNDVNVPILITAAAFYSRALSDAEVVEGCEYLKTLEVSV